LDRFAAIMLPRVRTGLTVIMCVMRGAIQIAVLTRIACKLRRVAGGLAAHGIRVCTREMIEPLILGGARYIARITRGAPVAQMVPG